MSRILKIDQFAEGFPSKYGLASDGSHYDVLEDFYCEALIDYDRKGKLAGRDILIPIWNKFKVIKGDTLISSKAGAYLQPRGYDKLIEIKPVSLSVEGDPSLDRFQENILSKIGKDVTEKKLMDRESRNEILLTRGI